MATTEQCTHRTWVIFCRVVDNLGDLGVCWRLACQLGQRGQQVHLWVDQPTALAWMARAGANGVQVLHWQRPFPPAPALGEYVLVEAFGCDIDSELIAYYVGNKRDNGQILHWINLEYLSAEPYAERCHKLPSPVFHGPGAGLSKTFFYPGFTAQTGGLLREPDLLQRQTAFDRRAWLHGLGVPWAGETLVSLFCYEPPLLAPWLHALASQTQPTRILVTPGRAHIATAAAIEQLNGLYPLWNKRGVLSFSYLPAVCQTEFDHLLWACDVNLVRGEDSLVRALWAAKPMVWHIYPQDDGAHHAKLLAFLDWLQAPASLRAFMLAWNGFAPCPDPQELGHWLNSAQHWQPAMEQARGRLLAQPDLVSQLLDLVSGPANPHAMG